MSATGPIPRPLRARKSLGQHFLAQASAVRRIALALDGHPGAPVLEIGPGRGALTAALIASAGRIAAVEVDAALAGHLRARFHADSLVLLEQDVLDLDLATVGPRLGHPEGTPLLVAGNLPYFISKPLANKLVRERAHVARAVLMFQQEVAARLTATPGSRAYGAMTVLVGEAFTVRRLFDLGPCAFRPPPKIVSTVTVWEPRPGAAFPPRDELRIRRVLAVAFAHRRRTLWNNLREALAGGEAAARALLERADLDGDLRAEVLPPAAFRRLADLWPD